MLRKEEMYQLIDEHPEYKELLFCKGYLITDNLDVDSNLFPFSFEHWRCEGIGSFNIWHDERMPLITLEKDNKTIFLLGHAYNPFTMQIEEKDLLLKLSELEGDNFWEYESQFTGVYMMGIISQNSIKHWVDCTGMLVAYYGKIDRHYYITSHVKIIGDLLDLHEDEYITRLKSYKYFHYFGNILPGNLSPFKELKRSVPNHYYFFENDQLQFKRFFPLKKIEECKNETEYNCLVEEVSEIMRNTMKLISKKWPNQAAAISVTGGKDSKMTLASANELYSQFKFFSYDSNDGEKVDFDAASQICAKLSLPHIKYEITRNDKDIKDIDDFDDILAYNIGNIMTFNRCDVRKRAILVKKNDFKIEVKSWVDEIGRARYHKRYRKKSFPKIIKPRYLTVMYKVFGFSPSLLHDTDRVFEDYIKQYITPESQMLFSWIDQIYWEFSWSACEGTHMINEQMLSWDITVPYNSRKLIEMLLKPTLSDRIVDRLQDDIVKKNNERLFNLNINIKDVNYSEKRSIIEKVYFYIRTLLPL